MKVELLEILCCPMCKLDLFLSITKEIGLDIIDGTLHCTKCNIDYPIVNGIPNMLPPNSNGIPNMLPPNMR